MPIRTGEGALVLRGKCAYIIGSMGLGFAIADRLAGEGCRIAFLDVHDLRHPAIGRLRYQRHRLILRDLALVCQKLRGFRFGVGERLVRSSSRLIVIHSVGVSMRGHSSFVILSTVIS